MRPSNIFMCHIFLVYIKYIIIYYLVCYTLNMLWCINKFDGNRVNSCVCYVCPWYVNFVLIFADDVICHCEIVEIFNFFLLLTYFLLFFVSLYVPWIKNCIFANCSGLGKTIYI